MPQVDLSHPPRRRFLLRYECVVDGCHWGYESVVLEDPLDNPPEVVACRVLSHRSIEPMRYIGVTELVEKSPEPSADPIADGVVRTRAD